MHVAADQRRERPGDRIQRVLHAGWIVAGQGEALEHEPRRQGTEPGREERADDASGELVRDEDREVPQRDARHRPDEDAHDALSSRTDAAGKTSVGLRADWRSWRATEPSS